MRWLKPLSSALVFIVLGQQLHDFWFHPEWTQAEQFWARWPLFACVATAVLVLSFLDGRTKAKKE